MTDLNLVNLLLSNVIDWNNFRENNPDRIVDLSNADLQNRCLINANLSKTNLSNACMQGSDLTSVNFTSANLLDCDLSNSILIDANLSNANISRTNFTEADLNGSKLEGAMALGAIFNRANLTGTYLKDLTISAKTQFSQTTCEFFFIEEKIDLSISKDELYEHILLKYTREIKHRYNLLHLLFSGFCAAIFSSLIFILGYLNTGDPHKLKVAFRFALYLGAPAGFFDYAFRHFNIIDAETGLFIKTVGDKRKYFIAPVIFSFIFPFFGSLIFDAEWENPFLVGIVGVAMGIIIPLGIASLIGGSKKDNKNIREKIYKIELKK